MHYIKFTHLQETLFEATIRKLTEKKRLRRQQKKELKRNGGDCSKLVASDESNDDDAQRAQLELMICDQNYDQDDYDMREIARHKKNITTKQAKKKRKKNQKAETDLPSGSDFKVDLDDNRFSELFNTGGKFGIDRTASDFKETDNMAHILKMQRKKRQAGMPESESDGKDHEHEIEHPNRLKSETKALVSKLKNKFK